MSANPIQREIAHQERRRKSSRLRQTAGQHWLEPVVPMVEMPIHFWTVDCAGPRHAPLRVSIADMLRNAG